MLTNRNALILRFATGNRQIISISTQLGQLLRNTLVDGIVQTPRHFLPRIVRIVEHSLIRIIPAINSNALIKTILRNIVALQGFNNCRTDESLQLLIIRDRIPQFLEHLDHTADNSRIGFGQRTVEVKQNDFLGLPGLFGHELVLPLLFLSIRFHRCDTC